MPIGYTIKSEIRLAAKRTGADKAIASLFYLNKLLKLPQNTLI
jgi:hypothetical protein